MDFTLTDEQQALADLAHRILSEQLPAEALRALEQTGDRFPAEVWAKLADAGLLGVAVPEEHGGLGFGLAELGLVLEQVGRYVAPVPLLASAVLGGLVVGRFGSPELAARLLPGVADGSRILTAALAETGLDIVPAQPTVTAKPAAPGAAGGAASGESAAFALSGTKRFVPAAGVAHVVLVPAATGDGAQTVFAVPTDAAGLSIELADTTNRELEGVLHFDGVEVGTADVVGAIDGGADIVAWLVSRAVVAHCAVQAGVCEGALRLTATYVSEREQFGSPIGTFQAVGQRAADAYIDTEAVRLTARQAAWALDADDSGEAPPGATGAADAVAIAKFWAAEGAQRVVHAAQHLHGGIGVDVDYPIHRYFRWAKVHELTLGGGTQHLLALADRL